SPIYEFGRFRLDLAAGQLLADGKPIALEPKVFQTLLFLVRNRGRLVEKDELMREIWPDRFVEETNLARNISVLRKVLGNDERGNLYIETAARRGYRFVGVVRQVERQERGVADLVALRQAEHRAGLEQADVSRFRGLAGERNVAGQGAIENDRELREADHQTA